MKGWAFLFFILICSVFISASACAATYYVDYACGTDGTTCSATGTSESTPWQIAPGMNGFAGTYTHQAGDHFIFKGGVTWPATAFPFNISYSGTSGNPDYYGVDKTWYAGTTWTRPLFDLNYTLLSGYGVPIDIEGQSYVTIDNIEIAHMAIPISAPYGAGSIAAGFTTVSNNITIQNCYIHDWRPLSTSVDEDNGGIFFNTGSGNVADSNMVGPGQAPDGTYNAASGACIRNGAQVSNNTLTNCSDMYVGGADLIYGNTFINSQNSFQQNPVFHPNAIWHVNSTNQTISIYNNFFSGFGTQYQLMLLHPGWDGATNTNYYVYNNVAVNAVKTINIDESGVVAANSNTNAYIFNNTLGPYGGMSIIDRSQTYHLTLVEAENNHWITDTWLGNGFCYNNAGGSGCGTANSIIDRNNITQGTAAAANQGYTIANMYAPTVSTGTTVTSLGVNLTGMGISSLNVDKLGASRPTGTTAWDIGAYQYKSIYIAQIAAGNADGTSCPNAYPVSFFNSAGNWGTGNGQIGPGTTVHLCGTLSSPISAQASGASGNPITIYFEPGANMTASSWSGSVISITGNYFVIDGGTNGVIAATNQGTVLGVQDGSTGVTIHGSNDEVKNLTITGMYVRTANSTDVQCNNDNSCGAGVVLNLSNASNDSIHNNTIINAGSGIFMNYNGTDSGISIYSNNISLSHWGIGGGDWPSGNLSNVDIYGNSITDGYVWQDPSDVYHLNGIYIWAQQSGSSLSGVRIHNNVIGGNWGNPSDVTALTWFSGNVLAPMLIYNNVYYSTSGGESNGYVDLSCVGGLSPLCGVYNNTFYAPSSSPTYVGIKGGSIYIEDNIIYGDSEQAIYAGDTGSSYSIVSDYNIFYGLTTNQLKLNGGYYSPSTWQAAGYDIHSHFVDPLFVNQSGLNFNLQSNSLAIGAGVNLTSYCAKIPTLCSDYVGIPRSTTAAWDMGAYQSNLGPQIYIAQNTQGTDDGSSPANAHSVAWFNTSSNWGTDSGQIAPGVTVHLSGRITSGLEIQGSGTAGSPITIHFEKNALMTASYWTSFSGTSPSFPAAIYDSGYSYIIIDGGTNGIINSTQNGTNLPYQIRQAGVYLYQANNVQIENLTINNMYVRTEGSDDTNAADAIDYYYGSHVRINNNTMSYCGNCIYFAFPSAASTQDIQIYKNVITKTSIGISFGSGGTGAIVDSVLIHDNDISDTNIWDCTSANPDANCLLVKEDNHQNGMHIFAVAGAATIGGATSQITHLQIYNNYLHGDIGLQSTAWVFLEGYISEAQVYNNIFNGSVNAPDDGYIYLKGASGTQVYNNTIFSSVGGTGIGLGEWAGNESGINIYNNIIDGAGFGIYDDTGTSGGPYTGGTYIQQALSMSDYNVFYYNPIGSLMIGSYNLGGSLTAWKQVKNSQGQSYDLHSQAIDPQLTGESNGDFNAVPASGLSLSDFQQMEASPARDAGTNLTADCGSDTALCFDMEGNQRPVPTANWDIGAYQSSSQTQGPILYGDANGDGFVTIYDAELTAQKAIGLSATPFYAANAEVDGTGMVDIYDAYLITEYVASNIIQFAAHQ